MHKTWHIPYLTRQPEYLCANMIITKEERAYPTGLKKNMHKARYRSVGKYGTFRRTNAATTLYGNRTIATVRKELIKIHRDADIK